MRRTQNINNMNYHICKNDIHTLCGIQYHSGNSAIDYKLPFTKARECVGVVDINCKRCIKAYNKSI